LILVQRAARSRFAHSADGFNSQMARVAQLRGLTLPDWHPLDFSDSGPSIIFEGMQNILAIAIAKSANRVRIMMSPAEAVNQERKRHNNDFSGNIQFLCDLLVRYSGNEVAEIGNQQCLIQEALMATFSRPSITGIESWAEGVSAPFDVRVVPQVIDAGEGVYVQLFELDCRFPITY
jgi:hypothetical protein